MTIIKAFRYRLSPSTKQEQKLKQFSGCRRFIWNWALNRKNDHYKEYKTGLSYYTLAKELVSLKKEFLFLKECQAQLLQQSLIDLDSAFKKFFSKKGGFPKFKRKGACLNSFKMPQNVCIRDGCVVIPKIGDLKAIIHRPLEGDVKSATIKQDSDGHWYVTFVCHIEAEIKPSINNNSVGIDVGLESFVTYNSGTKVAPPKFFRKGQRKLKKLQQKFSRSKKGSNNRDKARTRVAKQHCKVKNRRKDFLHKLSKQIVDNYGTICIEDLNLKGLVKTKLAKSFSDASLGTFIRMLEYKAQWGGKTVIKVGRFFASSKICHTCGYKQPLKLSDRKWTCEGCGVIHDRDVNAAKNILSEGLRIVAAGIADTQNAFRGDVSLIKTKRSPMKKEIYLIKIYNSPHYLLSRHGDL